MIRSKLALLLAAAIVDSMTLGCAVSREPQQLGDAPALRIERPASGPELPARPERPSLVCNYVASTSGQCFETVSEACKAMGCPEDECGTLYGSAPSGPLRLACN